MRGDRLIRVQLNFEIARDKISLAIEKADLG